MIAQFDRLKAIEWDVLCVLDACRWDYWNEQYGYGQAVQSPASCTKDWIGNFVREFDHEGITCVTANPMQRRHYDSCFQNRVDVWETHWKQFNGVPTVSPRDTTEAALPYLDTDSRLYVHYIQPHGPYAAGPKPVPVMRANPQANAVDIPDSEIPNKLVRNPMRLIHDKDSWLTAELLREAYRRNLKWVYDALLPFKKLDKTVVVTSDHGEFLADGPGDGCYGHPCQSTHPILRTVPLWEI